MVTVSGVPDDTRYGVTVTVRWSTTWADTVTVAVVVAANQFWSPAWLAVKVQVPVVANATVVPVSGQILGVVEARTTGSPELATAVASKDPPAVAVAGGGAANE